MITAREEILNRIRAAVADSPAICEYADLPRKYSQQGTLDEQARVQLFKDRLVDYGCLTYDSKESNLPDEIHHAAVHRAKRSLLIPAGFPRRYLPESIQFRIDDALAYDDLNACEGVLTGCALAIAVTGTIVLRHSKIEGRRALTLVPDYHLCIVYANQIVETVAEGIRQMMAFATAPWTTISGPSATSDIEMTRIKGVHGPRTLDVIVVA